MYVFVKTWIHLVKSGSALVSCHVLRCMCLLYSLLIFMFLFSVPLNTIETEDGIKVVTSLSTAQQTVQLTITKGFFKQETYGTIQTMGIIGCAAQCNFTGKKDTYLSLIQHLNQC